MQVARRDRYAGLPSVFGLHVDGVDRPDFANILRMLRQPGPSGAAPPCGRGMLDSEAAAMDRSSLRGVGARIGYLTYTRRFAAGQGDLAGEAGAAIAGRWCGRSQLDSHDACLTTFGFHDVMHLDGYGLCDVRALSAADGRAGFLSLSREETVVAGAREERLGDSEAKKAHERLKPGCSAACWEVPAGTLWGAVAIGQRLRPPKTKLIWARTNIEPPSGPAVGLPPGPDGPWGRRRRPPAAGEATWPRASRRAIQALSEARLPELKRAPVSPGGTARAASRPAHPATRATGSDQVRWPLAQTATASGRASAAAGQRVRTPHGPLEVAAKAWGLPAHESAPGAAALGRRAARRRRHRQCPVGISGSPAPRARARSRPPDLDGRPEGKIHGSSWAHGRPPRRPARIAPC